MMVGMEARPTDGFVSGENENGISTGRVWMKPEKGKSRVQQ
jgi:hypothetical protein